MNIYYLEGQASGDFYGDHPAVISSDRDGVLVECSFDQASRLACEWGLSAPMLAADGIHYSESGDAVYVAGGEIVTSAAKVARTLGWTESHHLDAEDYLQQQNRVF